MKATKRFSHGLEFGSAFTWAKQLTSGVEDDFGRGGGVIINDAFNRPNQKALSSYDQPFQFVLSGSYTTPRWSASQTGMKALSWIARDWQIGTLLRYASGLPIASPTSTNSLATYLLARLDHLAKKRTLSTLGLQLLQELLPEGPESSPLPVRALPMISASNGNVLPSQRRDVR